MLTRTLFHAGGVHCSKTPVRNSSDFVEQLNCSMGSGPDPLYFTMFGKNSGCPRRPNCSYQGPWNSYRARRNSFFPAFLITVPVEQCCGTLLCFWPRLPWPSTQHCSTVKQQWFPDKSFFGPRPLGPGSGGPGPGPGARAGGRGPEPGAGPRARGPGGAGARGQIPRRAASELCGKAFAL